MDHDSEGEESPNHNPRDFITPKILYELRHLDLGRIALRGRAVSNGGFADVCRARYEIKDRGKIRVAIKRLRFYLKEDVVRLFEREIYVWAKLKHENILPLLGYAFDETTLYPLLISEWMENKSVLDFVISHPDCDLLRIVTGIARGLQYLHDNDVVHCDIKPDNVLISKSGDALICDFGCSRIIAATRTFGGTGTGIPGTECYMAPELLRGSIAKHSKESDVWAFGMTVFTLLAREKPFAGKAPGYAILSNELPSLPQIPPSRTGNILWGLCSICWNQDPERRPNMGLILRKIEQGSQDILNSVDTLLDLLIILDATESMRQYMQFTRHNVMEICDMLSASGRLKRQGGLRVGLVAYRDYPAEEKYSVIEFHPFTEDLRVMEDYLTHLKVSGRSDRPEAFGTALEYTYEEIKDWRDDALKAIIVVTDAAPHGINEKGDSYPDGGPSGMDTRDPLEIARDMAEMGFSIFVLACEPTLGNTTEYAIDFYKAISTLTLGAFCSLTDSRLLATVIIGVVLERLDLRALSLRYREEIWRRIFEDGQPFDDDVAAEVHRMLSSQGTQVTPSQAGDMYNDVPAAIENYKIFLTRKSLSQAREALKKVSGKRHDLKAMKTLNEHDRAQSRNNSSTVSVRFKNTGKKIMELRFFDSERGDMIGEIVVPNGHVMTRKFTINIPVNFSITCGRLVKNFSRTFDTECDIDVDYFFEMS